MGRKKKVEEVKEKRKTRLQPYENPIKVLYSGEDTSRLKNGEQYLVAGDFDVYGDIYYYLLDEIGWGLRHKDKFEEIDDCMISKSEENAIKRVLISRGLMKKEEKDKK